MIHFILFPLLIVLWFLISRLAKKHPENVVFKYFRNFIFIWSLCTIVIGIAEEIFPEKSPEMFLTLAVILPFVYAALYYLLRIPFALTQKKEGPLPRFLSIAVFTLGIFYGLSLFIITQNLEPKAGPLSGFFTFLSEDFSTTSSLHLDEDTHSERPELLDLEESESNETRETGETHSEALFARPRIIVFEMITMLAVFMPVGLFFIFAIFQTSEWRNRIRSLLIGLGILAIGITEWSHVPGLDSANRDLFLIFGFVLLVAGLFYAERRIKASVL